MPLQNENVTFINFLNENIGIILPNIIAILTLLGSFYKTHCQYKYSMREKFFEIRYKAFSDYLELYSILMNNLDNPDSCLPLLSLRYNQVIILTLPQHYDVINNYYSSFVSFVDALKSNRQIESPKKNLVTSHKELMEFFSGTVHLSDPTVFKPPKSKRVKLLFSKLKH